MKMLVVCSDFPYPADHGGRVDTWGRIKVLAELGWKLHLLVCGKQQPSKEEMAAVYEYVEEITLCDRRSKLADLLHVVPMQVRSRSGLQHVELAGDYDYVLLEGDYVYPILQNPKIKHQTAILRVHNDEAVYFKALARSTKNVVHKMYYHMESSKFNVLQKECWRRSTNICLYRAKSSKSFRSKILPPKACFYPRR